jgi:amino acid adenylation domain-containing protein/FkbM family methyltransferase
MQSSSSQAFRASFLQQRLHALSTKIGRDRLRMECTLELDRGLDLTLLDRALTRLAAEHEVLRTSVEVVPGTTLVVQRIQELAASYLCQDQTGSGGSSPPQALGTKDGGFRAQVVSSERSHTLRIFGPDCGLDTRSFQILCGRLKAILAGQGESSITSEIQYADYAGYEETFVESDQAGEGQRYWMAQSAHIDESMLCPLDDVRLGVSARVTWLGARIETAQAGALERNGGAALESTLLAAWQSAVWRVCGRAVVHGVACDGRDLPELKHAIGLFERYLPVCGPAKNELWTGAVHRCHEALEKSRPWHLCWNGPEKLPRIEPAIPPFFPVAFAYEDIPDAGTACTCHTDAFLVKLLCKRTVEGAVEADLWFDEAALDPADARFLLDSFIRLLDSVAHNPHIAISEIGLAGPEELEFWTTRFNTHPEEAEWEPVTTLVSRQAAAHPDAIAIQSECGQWTYQQVEDRVAWLAGELRRLGASLETVVAVEDARSAETLIALLAVLETGAAFTPIDAANPDSRIRLILKQTSARIAVTTAALHQRLAGTGVRTVMIGEIAASPASRHKAWPPSNIHPESLAYVMVTSGSSGQPKGVMVTQRGLSNYVVWASRSYMPEGGTIPVHSPITFDLTVTAWLCPLAAGGTVVLLPAADGAESLATNLAAHPSHAAVKLTPAHLNWITQSLPGPALPDASRMYVIGGETLRRKDLEFLRRHAPRARIINEYGPTETVVGCCVFEASQTAPETANDVPIGSPIANTTAYVLDGEGHLLPPGRAGELFIGGAGVARGYCGRPDLTAERFVPDSLGGTPGQRIYRTGDRARLNRQGQLEYLGRRDGQIKLRGHRIELGEIRSVLASHSAIGECIVALKGNENARRLVAYIRPRPAYRRLPRPDRLYLLPNGLEIAHQNANETAYLYAHVFESESYLAEGIQLPPGACVVDVGANIGMFSLLVLNRCADARIFAFEPIPRIYENLRYNVQGALTQVRTFRTALGRTNGAESFTYYPLYSMMSGRTRDADAAGDLEMLRKYLANERLADRPSAVSSRSAVNTLLEERFDKEFVECTTRRLSGVIAEERIAHIDLLKIDVQRAELDVLIGISAEDWELIDQIVMEVHDDPHGPTAGRLGAIRELLQQQGFRVNWKQNPLLRGTDLYDLWAIRPKCSRAGRPGCQPPEWLRGGALADELMRLAKAKLPVYMTPSAVVAVDEFPLTPNGKIAENALPDPESARPSYVPPNTPAEEIVAGIWSDILGTGRISTDEDFFAIGGHSLLAMQVVSRICEAFSIAVSIRAIFEHPTIRGLAQAITSMRTFDPESPIGRAPRTGDMPLSFAQQRMWFLHRLLPDSPSYNIPCLISISGRLDIHAVKKSITEIVRRHEILRTIYPGPDGHPTQQVLNLASTSVAMVDLTSLLPPMRAACADQIARMWGHQPFDLECGPVFRTAVVQTEEHNYLLCAAVHHIAADGWSMSILAREFGTFYRIFIGRSSLPLPELQIQYSDYAYWQRKQSAGDKFSKQLEYWSAKLKNLPRLDLPRQSGLGVRRGHHGERVWFTVPAGIASRLRELAKVENSTLFILLLSCCAVLLRKYTGANDIPIGSIIANRNKREIETLIGFFVNTLVLRCRLDGNATFRETLGRIRTLVLEAYDNSDLPFDRVVEELEPERDGSQSPLFNTLCSLQNTPAPLLELEDLRIETLSFDNGAVAFDLALNFSDAADGLGAVFEYSSGRFSRAAIEALRDHFIHMAGRLTLNPAARLADLGTLTPTEERLQLERCRGAESALDQEPIHCRVLAQCEESPDAVAVVFGEHHLSYHAYRAAVARISQTLAPYITPGSSVVVISGSGLLVLPALTAVLAAGAAFAPLDPSLSAEHIRNAVALIRPAAILIQRQCWKAWQDLPAPRLCFEDAAVAPLGNSRFQPFRPASLMPAYVRYTSSSTPPPTALTITHQWLLNHARWMEREFNFQSSDRVFQKIPFISDTAWGFFAPLRTGGTAVLARSGELDPLNLARTIQRESVTILRIAPSTLTALADEPEFSECRSLRVIFNGGETFSNPLVKRLSTRVSAELVNLYGPSDALTGVTWRRCAGSGLPTVSIGGPIDNLRTLVLDADGHLAPFGIAGELFLSGIEPALGYLGSSSLTAAKFLPDRFSGVPGARMYRTGDRVRWSSEGELEFLGSIDRQIKIRGQHIEPTEIEEAVLNYPGVRRCVILTNGAREVQLTAYYTATPDVSSSALRTRLRDQLPAYMVPAAFVRIEKFPTTPSGTIDETALANLGPDAQDLEHSPPLGLPAYVRKEKPPLRAQREYSPPRDPVEAGIAELWAGLLRAERIGIFDNFFEAGGNSLLLTQLASRIFKRFHIEVPLQRLFDAITISDQAELLAEYALAEATSNSSEIEEILSLSPGEVDTLLRAQQYSEST